LRLVSPPGGALELARQIAAPRIGANAKLHDRTRSLVSVEGVERSKSEVVHYIQAVLARIEDI
jgi:hypothetical protein